MADHVDWGRRDYAEALPAMRALRAARRRGEIPDTLILVEHPSVYTVGVQGTSGETFPPEIPVVRVERGGHSTYHGPGQLVGYPIVDLDPRGRDVRRFVHDVEGLVTETLAEFGVEGGHVSGQPGVWIEGRRKIASVGIAVEEWVSFHGVALNVDTDLAPFRAIRPCGLDGAIMTSLTRELGRPVFLEDVKPAFLRAWARRFGREPSFAPAVRVPVSAG